MRKTGNHIQMQRTGWALVLDLSDCYTWSFPEFLPFCVDLFYFSSLKDFDASVSSKAA